MRACGAGNSMPCSLPWDSVCRSKRTRTRSPRCLIKLARNGWMPNNENLAVLLYRRALSPPKEDPASVRNLSVHFGEQKIVLSQLTILFADAHSIMAIELSWFQAQGEHESADPQLAVLVTQVGITRLETSDWRSRWNSQAETNPVSIVRAVGRA
jgi:hypothetical protein